MVLLLFNAGGVFRSGEVGRDDGGGRGGRIDQPKTGKGRGGRTSVAGAVRDPLHTHRNTNRRVEMDNQP